MRLLLLKVTRDGESHGPFISTIVWTINTAFFITISLFFCTALGLCAKMVYSAFKLGWGLL